jgi:hypothetical protein
VVNTTPYARMLAPQTALGGNKGARRRV